MKKLLIWSLAVIFGVALSAESMPAVAQAKTTFITIGTGGIHGYFYAAGGAIGKIFNKKFKQYGIRIAVESTGGSVYNINAIMTGDMEFGIVQSDRQYQAINGLAEWKDKGTQKDLRAIFSINTYPVALVAADGTGIKTITDLKGKRVNIGRPGTGQRINSIHALRSAGIDYKTNLKAEGIKATQASKLLQQGRIDAFFYSGGHPSGVIKAATSGKKKVHFVPITGVERLIKRYPYYSKSTIPIAFYPGANNKQEVPTFGVKATFVTSVKVPDDIVYAITREVFENFEEFKKLHPALWELTKGNMLEGMSAPIHPGAMKYYFELLRQILSQ